MQASSSQEQTIRRSLTGQIQMGFYDSAPFPSVQEVAQRYGVSYCPAQRALKEMEKRGLIRLARGKETVILTRPYEDYLQSSSFSQRAGALSEILMALQLLSPSITIQGIWRLNGAPLDQDPDAPAGKRLYLIFDELLRALGNRALLNLYYDLGAFIESSFLDIFYAQLSPGAADALLSRAADDLVRACAGPLSADRRAVYRDLVGQSNRFSAPLLDYLAPFADHETQTFHWKPRKGRTRYSHNIAIDLICKIHQGTFPPGSFLPPIDTLSEIYHVSSITMRRTLELLSRSGVTYTYNGVGTQVLSTEDTDAFEQIKSLGGEEDLLLFLEALQLLTITGGPVILDTFPHFEEQDLANVQAALSLPGEKASMIAVFSACMQAVVHRAPLAAVREIYEKITLLLLPGGLLRMQETGREPFPDWPRKAARMQEQLHQKDAAGFAASFCRLCEENFSSTKAQLVGLGIARAKDVADITPI